MAMRTILLYKRIFDLFEKKTNVFILNNVAVMLYDDRYTILFIELNRKNTLMFIILNINDVLLHFKP